MTLAEKVAALVAAEAALVTPSGPGDSVLHDGEAVAILAGRRVLALQSGRLSSYVLVEVAYDPADLRALEEARAQLDATQP